MATKKKFFLVSTKAKGLKFEIVELNREEMKATLRGDTGVDFTASVTQAELDRLGYTIDIRDVEILDDAPVHSESQAA